MIYNIHIVRVLIITAVLLCIPFVAMQVTQEVDWTAGDFVAAGLLIFSAGFAYEITARKAGSAAYRIAAAASVLSALGLIWVNLAVGILNFGNNPANALYLAVPLIGIVGAALSRLDARGMMRTLLAMACAQVLIPILAFFVWKPDVISTELAFDVVRGFGASCFFAALFAVSSVLFVRAARESGEMS